MNVSDEIIKILDYLGDKFGVAVDWTDSEVLPYIEQICQKYIRYEIASSILWIIIAIVTCIVCTVIAKNLYHKIKDIMEYTPSRISDNDILVIILFILLIFIVFGFICAIIYQIFDILTCITFPDKAIFDYANKMVDLYLD